MRSYRTILHLDLDAFYCAVEQNQDSSLVGRPFAVGGRPDERGVVSSCSYAARRKGVRSAMPMAQALRKCPGLRIISPRHMLYVNVSELVMERLRQFTSFVEQISIDEAFLDVSLLDEPGISTARRLQQTINLDLHLPCSIGVASNKLVAKIANDYGKMQALEEMSADNCEPPNKITVVPPGEESVFLAPLPVRMLWGVGPKTAERLAKIDIHKIGELASYPSEELTYLFGKNGNELSIRSKGIDDRPVITEHEPKSFSQEVTFSRDVRDGDILIKTLRDMAGQIAKSLDKGSYYCSTVKIKLRWPDFTTLTRQITLQAPSNQSEVIATSAIYLFKKEWQVGRAVRLIGIGVSNLGPPVHQLNLWEDVPRTKHLQDEPSENLRATQLKEVIEELNQRFGEGSVILGSQLVSTRHG